MKKKTIIQMIKDESNHQIIPDVKTKILSNVSYKDPVAETKKTPKIRFTLRFAPMLAVCLILVLSMALIIKTTSNSSQNGSNQTALSKPKQAYAMQAVTLFNFANNFDSQGVRNVRMKKLNRVNQINQTTSYQEIANEINKYYLTATDLLNQDNIKYDVKESDITEYTYAISINIDLLSYDETYILYYNEEHKNELDHNKKLDEVSTIIKGIIKCDDKEYLVEGIKELEQDESEVELILYLDNDTYIKVEQEIEKRENEYSYSYYDHNILVEEYEISVEQKGSKKVVELELIKDKIAYEFEFIYFKDYIKCEYEIASDSGEVDIYIDEKGSHYHFNSENIITI